REIRCGVADFELRGRGTLSGSRTGDEPAREHRERNQPERLRQFSLLRVDNDSTGMDFAIGIAIGTAVFKRLLAVAAVAAVIGGCTESPTTPAAPTVIQLGGAWIGSVTVLDTTARMTWTLSQTGTSVQGPVILQLSNGTVLLNGFLTGTVNGSALTYVISVGPGGIPTNPNCVGQIGGTMTATISATATMTGTSSVTSSTCTPPFAGGNLTMTR